MKIQITKKIGRSTLMFEVDEAKEIDALAKAASFTTMPEECGNCKSPRLELDSNHAKGFTFIKIKCLACGWRSNMGQLKEGGYFWKDFEKYERPADKKE